MLKNQKFKFNLTEDVTYLNTSYMSPNLKTVEKTGIEAIQRKSNPYTITPQDFFDPVTNLKKLYAKLIDVNKYNRIACIPSVSYGIACVTNNIKLKKGDEILVIEDQFPSNYYAWEKLAKKYDAVVKIIDNPKTSSNRSELWNKHILNGISEKTAVVAMCHVHWADGSLFDLMSIRDKTKQHNALLIIDGTQSVGAYPFSVNTIQPDALICAAYKWLFGPYSFGFAYFGSYFDNGTPIEESWYNRMESENFAGLTNYNDTYKPGAHRFDMGETANFISVPMATAAIEQIIEWTPNEIQLYCHNISKEALVELQTLGFTVEDDAYRGYHLIGVEIPEFVNIEQLKMAFEKNNIFVSIRGNYIRVAPHLYNLKDDFTLLVETIKSTLN